MRKHHESGPSTNSALVNFYESKTNSILERYGPGPLVHYHTGFMVQADLSRNLASIRAKLVAAQEEMLYYAANAWQLKYVPFRDVLDVGCGLGGGAIFWAQGFGAHVTAITIAPSHVGFVAKFSAQAGVESLVRPLLCDALTLPGEHCYDAVMAIDSSSSFPRRPWFDRLAALLRPGGRVFIFDCFLERDEYAGPFNRHWNAQIGTVDEYLSCARQAGFKLETFEDVSRRTLHFWITTLAVMQMETQNPALTCAGKAALAQSLRIHALIKHGILAGGLRHILLSLVKN
jgi:tocopherol O-methyltransferase